MQAHTENLHEIRRRPQIESYKAFKIYEFDYLYIDMKYFSQIKTKFNDLYLFVDIDF